MGSGRPYIVDAIEKTGPAIERMCAEVWQGAELSQDEVKSAQIHIRELEAAGLKITTTKQGTGSVPIPGGCRCEAH